MKMTKEFVHLLPFIIGVYKKLVIQSNEGEKKIRLPMPIQFYACYDIWKGVCWWLFLFLRHSSLRDNKKVNEGLQQIAFFNAEWNSDVFEVESIRKRILKADRREKMWGW